MYFWLIINNFKASMYRLARLWNVFPIGVWNFKNFTNNICEGPLFRKSRIHILRLVLLLQLEQTMLTPPPNSLGLKACRILGLYLDAGRKPLNIAVKRARWPWLDFLTFCLQRHCDQSALWPCPDLPLWELHRFRARRFGCTTANCGCQIVLFGPPRVLCFQILTLSSTFTPGITLPFWGPVVSRKRSHFTVFGPVSSAT